MFLLINAFVLLGASYLIFIKRGVWWPIVVTIFPLTIYIIDVIVPGDLTDFRGVVNVVYALLIATVAVFDKGKAVRR